MFGPGNNIFGCIVNYIFDGLDSLWIQLNQDGLKPGVIRTEDYGTRQFALIDPDGYEIAVTGQ